MKSFRKAIVFLDQCFKSDIVKPPEPIQPIILQDRPYRSAQDVFREFSVDAAMGAVHEMKNSKTSTSRLRGIELVLGYGLGKPINRSVSWSGHIPDAAEEEIENDIRSLAVELGFTSGKGKAARILLGPKEPSGQIEAPAVQTPPPTTGSEDGIPREISTELEESPNLPSR